MSIVIGIIGIVVGFLIIWKSEWILDNLGRVDWAEAHLGSEGGTRIFYKLVGTGIILLSFLFMTGILQKMVLGFFTPLFRGLGST